MSINKFPVLYFLNVDKKSDLSKSYKRSLFVHELPGTDCDKWSLKVGHRSFIIERIEQNLDYDGSRNRHAYTVFAVIDELQASAFKEGIEDKLKNLGWEQWPFN